MRNIILQGLAIFLFYSCVPQTIPTPAPTPEPEPAPTCETCQGYSTYTIPTDFYEIKTLTQGTDDKFILAGTLYTFLEFGLNGDFMFMMYNNDGSLDTNFDYDGLKNIPIGSYEDELSDAILLSNGKILSVGSTNQGDEFSSKYDAVLMQLNNDGTLDSNFGSGGISITRLDPTQRDSAKQVAELNDGKLIVFAKSGSDNLILRYLSDGTLDTSFGVAGITEFSAPVPGANYDTVSRIVLEDNGKIVLSGTTRLSGFPDDTHYFFIARLNSDGTLDTTFGNNGATTVSIGLDTSQHASSLIQQDDGKFVLGGRSSEDEIISNLTLIRFNNNGTLDTTFDFDGKVVATLRTGSTSGALDIGQQSDGKLVISGSYDEISQNNAMIVRLNPDGSFDTTFVGDPAIGDGIVLPPIDGYFIANEILIQPDQKIVSFGVGFVDPESLVYISRLNANGTMDTSSFGPQ